jgi:hypothetical protein
MGGARYRAPPNSMRSRIRLTVTGCFSVEKRRNNEVE